MVDGKLYVQKEELQPARQSEALRKMKLLPVGSEMKIYYNPEEPYELTSEPSVKEATFYYLGFSLCWLVSAVVVIGLNLQSVG